MVGSVFIASNQAELSVADHSMFDITMKDMVPDAEPIDLDPGLIFSAGGTPLCINMIFCEVTPAPLTVISAERGSTVAFSS